MNRHIIIAFLLAMVGWAVPATADPIANVVAVQGSPTSSGPGGNRALLAGNELSEGDKITVTSGNAQILFVDGTKLVIGPNSSLMISKVLMQGSGNTAKNLSINALRGTFRFITGKSPKNAYNIQTANATIGIRGTGFDFWVVDATGVALLQGKVRLCSKSGGKACVDLNPTCEVGVAAKGNASILFGQDRANTLRNRLPYVFNQTSLNKEFRLNTNACKIMQTRSYGIPDDGNIDRSGKPNQQPCSGGGNIRGGKGC